MMRSEFEAVRLLSIFLDPVRQAPDGAITCRAVTEVIEWLKTGRVEHLDVACASGVHGLAGEPALFHLAFALHELIGAGAVPTPSCDVHGGTIEEARFCWELLSAACYHPKQPAPTIDRCAVPGTCRRLADLDANQVARLLRLNAVLFEVERWVLARSREMILHWSALACGVDDDLEIEPVIRYRLRQDDPRYREDDDNFIAVSTIGSMATGLRKRQEEGRIACAVDERALAALDTEDCNHGPRDALRHLGEVRHSRLFHDLYDHQLLSWDDLLSIGSIWVRLRCEHQCDFVVDPALEACGPDT